MYAPNYFIQSLKVLVHYKQFIFHKGKIKLILKIILFNGQINSRHDIGFCHSLHAS